MIVYKKDSSSLWHLSYIYIYMFVCLMETQGIYIGQIKDPFSLRFVP